MTCIVFPLFTLGHILVNLFPHLRIQVFSVFLQQLSAHKREEVRLLNRPHLSLVHPANILVHLLQLVVSRVVLTQLRLIKLLFSFPQFVVSLPLFNVLPFILLRALIQSLALDRVLMHLVQVQT